MVTFGEQTEQVIDERLLVCYLAEGPSTMYCFLILYSLKCSALYIDVLQGIADSEWSMQVL
jgi:hypothetical protein